MPMTFTHKGIKFRTCSKVCKGKLVSGYAEATHAAWLEIGDASVRRRECANCGEYLKSGMMRRDRPQETYVPLLPPT